MTWAYRCLIVPDAHAQLARDLCAAISPGAGEGMWTTGLSETGAFPATHWISAGLITAGFASLMPLTTYTEDGPVTLPGHASVAVSLASEAGFVVTVEAVQALFDSADVTEDEAHAAMSRMGLVMAVEDDPT